MYNGIISTGTFTHTFKIDNQSFGSPIVFADLNIIQILKSIFWGKFLL